MTRIPTRVFDYEQALNHLTDRRILSLVSAIREERGHQDIYLSTKPEQLPSLSQRTIERALSKLQKEGKVSKVGAARATRYLWVR